MPKVLITTVPYADKNRLPIEMLEEAGIEFVINPIGRKLQERELAELVKDFDVIIAGTEPITDTVLSRAARLKLISRVGIGLDSVDLLSARRRGIRVSYTPDAPAPAVIELTLALMLSLLRSVHVANLQLHNGVWHRYFGRRLSEVCIGIIGVGRIGTGVLRAIGALGNTRVLLNDLDAARDVISGMKVEWVAKDDIYRHADLISLHLPLTSETRNMIGRKQLLQMKPNAMLVNTSRGGIINESDLIAVMQSGHLDGAALDVFTCEPYAGELATIKRCILTSHMGSMSIDCRMQMEIEAAAEAVRFLTGKPLQAEVPETEYHLQSEGL